MLFAEFTLTNIVGLLLTLLGVGLVILEMMTPGIGAPGICGGICVIAGSIIAADSFLEWLVIFAVVLVILAIALVFALRSLAKGRLSKSPIVLNNEQSRAEGFRPAGDMTYLVGKTGVALTTLRPAGIAAICGERVDVVSNGEFITKDSAVIVSLVDGQRIVVSQYDKEDK